MKHRLVHDCRVSGTNSATAKWERIWLPKVWGVIRDTLTLKADAQPDWVSRYLVCDISDAFYKVPLLPEERPYFVLQFNPFYFVLFRLVQGSLIGPTLFGRLSAILGRASLAIWDFIWGTHPKIYG